MFFTNVLNGSISTILECTFPVSKEGKIPWEGNSGYKNGTESGQLKHVDYLVYGQFKDNKISSNCPITV